MKINKIIGLACALGVLGSFAGNAECISSGEEDNLEAPAAKMGRVAQKIDDLRQRAEASDAAAQYELGLRYNMQHNYTQAFELYKKSADQGFAPAQYNLGQRYRDGIGVDKDEKRAAELFQKAAKNGDTAAISRLNHIMLRNK